MMKETELEEELVDIEKGLAEGWLHPLSSEKAKTYLWGDTKFVKSTSSLIDRGLVRCFWDDTVKDVVIELTEKGDEQGTKISI